MSIDTARASAPLGYQALTVSTAAVSPTVPTGAAVALITVESNPIRWRDDGSAPTAAVGTPQTAGQALWYQGSLARLQLIRSGGVDATVHFNYYG